jgi:hypothetical protein
MISMVFVACGGESKELAKDDKVTTDEKVVQTKTDEKSDEAKSELKLEFPDDWTKAGNFSYKLLETKIVTGYNLAGMSLGEEAGQVYVWAKFICRNDGKDKATFSSLFADAKIISPDGKEFGAEVLTDGVLNDTEFTSGKESTGEWYFKVPGDTNLSVSGWKLTMKTPDILADEKVIINIP